MDKLTDRQSQIAEAIETLEPEGFTSTGAPSVDALSIALEEKGYAKITKAERDTEWEAISAHRKASESSDAAKAEVGETTITPTEFTGALAKNQDDGDLPAALRDHIDVTPEIEKEVAKSAADKAERDKEEADLPPVDMVEVSVTKSSSDPVILHVHGIGRFTIPRAKDGNENWKSIPRAALGALSDSDVQFTTREIKKGA